MVRNKNIYNIGCATLVNGKLYNITTFSGNKKEIIEYINKEVKRRLISDYFNNEPVFNLTYDENDNDRLNLEYWYTISQLIEMGACL